MTDQEQEQNDVQSQEDRLRERQILDQDVLLAWQVVDASHLQRGAAWYVLAVFFAMLMILYAIITQAWTLAVLVSVLAGVVFLMSQEAPQVRQVIVTKLGIHLNKKYYPYNQIKSFWFLSEPGYNCLYLQLASKFNNVLRIPLEKESPVLVREILSAELDEAPSRGEQLTDTLARRWKL